VRLIESLVNLMCKAQLLLKVSLHVLDKEIKLLDFIVDRVTGSPKTYC
jgi:hypothetical protein